MKTILLLVILCPAASFAWEIPKNPDRFPSLGLNISNADYDGSSQNVLWVSPVYTLNDNYKSEYEERLKGFDLRLPLHESFTFEFGFDRVKTHSKKTLSNNKYIKYDDLNGNSYKLGVRFYFNQ